MVVLAGGLRLAGQASAGLSLEEALVLAEGNNPQLRAASAALEGATAGILTARAYPNPEVNILTGPQYSREFIRGPGPNGLLQHYSFAQPIETGLVRQTRILEAQRRRDVTDYGLSDARLAVRAAVKQSFFDVLRRQEEVAVTTENLRAVEEFLRRVRVQVEVGEAARLELTRAEAEVATARTIARSAELRLITARSLLRSAVSAPLPEPLVLTGSLPAPPAIPPLEQLRRDLVERHPLLAQAQSEIERAQARLRQERALRTPQPLLRGEWERQPDLGFYRVGVTIPIPAWNQRQGPIGEATAGVTQANALLQFRRLELTAALERAYGMYGVANQQVTAFQEGVLRQAQAAVEAAEAAFRFGERGVLEVLDAQRVLRSVSLDFLNAQYDRQAALIELERLRAVELRSTP